MRTWTEGNKENWSEEEQMHRRPQRTRRPIRNWASVTTPLCLRNGGPRNTRKDAKWDERCGLGGPCHIARPDIGRGRDALLRDPAWHVQKTCNANISSELVPGVIMKSGSLSSRRFHDAPKVWAPAESTPTLCFLCYLLFKLFSLLPSVKAVSGNLNHQFSRCFSPFQIAVRLGEFG
jgi:hypothetical protein